MSDHTENHTIKLLQELRKEMREGFDAVKQRFDAVDERFDGTDARIDGLTHIMTLMAGHSHDLDERLARLEER